MSKEYYVTVDGVIHGSIFKKDVFDSEMEALSFALSSELDPEFSEITGLDALELMPNVSNKSVVSSSEFNLYIHIYMVAVILVISMI